MKEKLKSIDKKKLVIIILIILTIIRLLIGIMLPVSIHDTQKYDDALMHSYAFNIREFHWLGRYDHLTLAKGISFSVFMALCNFLYIPYSIGLTLLHIFSVFCIVKALKPKFSNKTLSIMYVLLLFSPAMFDSSIAQRLYRNAILPPATLLVFAGFIGMYLRKDKPIKENIFFILLSIFSLIFFWHIKEDSIWVLPFTLTISLITIIYWIINDRKKIILKIFLILLPFISLFTFNRVYSFINYKLYGVYEVFDRSEGNFARMVKDILLIEDSKNTRGDLWITSRTINKLYEISPTFQKLKPTMDTFEGWLEEDGEVKGDWMVWRIRTVMYVNRLYNDAVTADDFCKQVAIEIESAFEKGLIKKDKKMHISSQMKGIDSNDLIDAISLGHKWFYEVGSYDRISASNAVSTGERDAIKKVQLFTSVNIIYENSNRKYKVVDETNKIVDVYKFFGMPTTILGVICFIFITIKTIINMFKKKFEDLDLYIVIIGILLSFILLLVEIALFTTYFYEQQLYDFRNFYCASIYPLFQLFKYMSIIICVEHIIKYIKNKKVIAK